MFFETNGVPRMVEVDDRQQAATGAAASKRASRERADPGVLGSVASPMSGEIIEIVAKPGAAFGLRPSLRSRVLLKKGFSVRTLTYWAP